MQEQTKKVLKGNPNVLGKPAVVDASGYVINPNVKLPPWVKCLQCGGRPTPTDWLKPIHPLEPGCRHLIHLSHIPDGPRVAEEAGFIARNS